MQTAGRDLGELLETARTDLGYTRKAALHLYAERFGETVHTMTLYRYEKGLLPVPPLFLQNICVIYGISNEDLVGTPKTQRILKVALSPYPDAALFSAISCFPFPGIEDDFPPVRAMPEPVLYQDILPRLRAGTIDIALYNRDRFFKEQDLQEQGIVCRGPILRFRGNALLTPNTNRWKTFSQHYLENKDHQTIRRNRISKALLMTLLQFRSHDGSQVRILVPGDTDRSASMIQLLKVALNSEMPLPDRQFLESLLSDVNAVPSSYTGYHALRDFLRESEARGSCFPTETQQMDQIVFVGGLSTRVIAERAGAGVVIDNDDLHRIATLDPLRLSRIFFPTNLVLIRREAWDECSDTIDGIRIRWNAALQTMLDSESMFFQWANPKIDRLVMQAISALYPSDQSESVPWEEGQGIFERMTREQLMEFMHWTRESDRSILARQDSTRTILRAKPAAGPRLKTSSPDAI